MKNYILLTILGSFFNLGLSQEAEAKNPIIFADVPDMSMVREGDTYYMSSTTMHMTPGVPIMKSKDLSNWELVNYAYKSLGDIEELNLEDDKNAYGRGSWASCIRFHNGRFYVFTFSGTTDKTYVYSTKDIEHGAWEVKTFEPSYHDLTVFFDDDGKVYMIWGNGKLMLAELKEDLTGVKEGTQQVLIENASTPAGENIMLGAEGSQLFKVNNTYYLFNIVWPRGGMRTVLVYRSDHIRGLYEGKVALRDRGIAQGGLIDTPDGRWFAYLFRDYGSVGRIPYLAPVTWQDGWPVLGVEGKVPDFLELPPGKGLIPKIVGSDEFNRTNNDPRLPPVWQWNHNSVDSLWSLSARKGYLRLTNGRIDKSLIETRNTLTQRTIGPACSGTTSLDVSNMKDGDFTGLALLQKKYGLVGVKFENGSKKIVMISAEGDNPEEIEAVPLEQNVVYLKADCDFGNMEDRADFYYSLDEKKWTKIGSQLQMAYTLPHFMGYRYGLFNYATRHPGGYVDFDYFHIENKSKNRLK
jgi:beta-xylosidase